MSLKRLAVLLLSVSQLFAGQALQITGDTGSYTIPASSPFTSIGSRRIEGRVDLTNWDCTGNSYGSISNFGDGLRVGCVGGAVTRFRDSPNVWLYYIDASTRTDILFRAQIIEAGDAQPLAETYNGMAKGQLGSDR